MWPYAQGVPAGQGSVTLDFSLAYFGERQKLEYQIDVQKGKTPMYARAITFQYQPGKIDEGLNILRETVVPELQQQPGFQGATNLVDRGNNKVVGITLWRSEADLQASGMSKLQARFAKVSSFLAAVPTVESYEVTDDQRC